MPTPANEVEAAAPLPESATLVGACLDDRYKIEALLGQGGMGTVYRAEHIHMRRKVALKVLHAELAAREEFAARFEREAIAVGRIEHPNVAKAMDFGRLTDGSFYFVIEYVDGASLRQLLAHGPLAPANALEIAGQIANAVNAAHQAGVVHRDLKPDNVMIAERDGQGCQVKVLDFGVARLASDEGDAGSAITRYGAIIGTPEYMAPEQAGGKVVDYRADLYALGVILYELLAGRPPFSGDDGVVVLSKHFTEPPPALPAEIPSETRALVFDLLEKDPDRRIQTASELVQRIVQARAAIEPAAPVARRSSSKKRAAVLAFAMAGAGGAVGLLTHERQSKPLPASAAASTAATRTAAASSAAPLVPAPAPRPSSFAVEQTQTPAPDTEAEATAAPPPSPPGASETRPTGARRNTVVVRPGQKVVIRRRVVRRTVITTSR